MKVIVIGGVAAGMSAASKIRRNQYNAEVTVYERDSHVSYGACGLPYFISDEIKESSAMIARTMAEFNKMGINVFTKHEVIEVLEADKKVVVRNLKTQEVFEDSYDELIVASGASPVLPPWEGINLGNVFTLSTLEEGERIKAVIQQENIEHVVIIGAGFIGVELVEAGLTLKKTVHLIEFKNQILPHIDKELAGVLHEELEKNGAHVKVGEKVLSLEGQVNVERVQTNKNCYTADLVIVCVGVKPNTSFLKETSVERLTNGAIVVDKKMQSSSPHIHGAGDCATVYNRLKDKVDDYIPLGTNANKQGKLLGAILTGEKLRYKGTLGTSMIKVCGMEAAKTGLSELDAIQGNYDYIKSVVVANNHASYYPNPKAMTIKVLADPQTRKLLGAQIIGYQDAAIRIDIFALAIHTGITVDELGWVDFGYAPPFASVWDAVHIAANAIK